MGSSVTVFDDTGHVLLDKLQNHIEWMIKEGVDGISPLGSSGEFVALEMHERKAIIEKAAEIINGRVFMLAGTHHYATNKTIELSKHAERAGADGLLIVPPYYMLTTVEQVKNHYRLVASTVTIPIVVYHNFASTHVDLSDEDLVELYNEGAIAGVKLSNTNGRRVLNLLQMTNYGLKVYAGIDLIAFEALCYGAHGWISGVTSIVPGVAKEVYTLIMSGELEKARALWIKIWPLIQMEFASRDDGQGPHWFSVMKAALNLLGLDVGDPLLPIDRLTDPYLKALGLLLENLGYKVMAKT